MKGTLPERLLNKKGVAALLGINPRTVDNWIYQRFIPHLKIGGVVRFRPADIEQFLEKHFVPSDPIHSDRKVRAVK